MSQWGQVWQEFSRNKRFQVGTQGFGLGSTSNGTLVVISMVELGEGAAKGQVEKGRYPDSREHPQRAPLAAATACLPACR